MTPQDKYIMLVASGGGHWTQLMRLRPAFLGRRAVYVGVKPFYREEVRACPFEWVPDVSRLNKWSVPLTIIKLIRILLKYRPSVIVTTGSLPGLMCLRLGKLLLNSKTVWIDSIANVEDMSASGKRAKKYADLWLTQWGHLARPDGPRYLGSVM